VAIAKVADRATVNGNAAVTTVDLVLASMTVGNLLIIRTAADNSGGSGAARTVAATNQSGTPIAIGSIRQYQQLNDPGAASAGTTLNVLICEITATSGTVRLTYSGSVVQSCVAEEWPGPAAAGMASIGSIVVGTPVGANGTASTNMASLTDASAAAGNLVYAAMAIEGPSGDTYVQDADITGGAWTGLTKAGTTNATADTNQTVYGAYKVPSAAGGQTYNPTITVNARDTAGLILELAQAPSLVTVTPATLTLTPEPVTPTPQPVNVTLTPATLTLAAEPVTPTPGVVTVSLSPAALTFTAQPVTAAPVPLEVTVSPATLTLTVEPVTPTPQPVHLTLTPAALVLEALPATPTPGVVTVEVSPAQLSLVVQPATPTPQLITIALTPAALTFEALPVTATPPAVVIELTPASLTFSAIPATPQPQPVIVALVPSLLTLAAVPVTLETSVAEVTLSPATLALTVAPATPTPQPVTLALSPADPTLIVMPVTPRQPTRPTVVFRATAQGTPPRGNSNSTGGGQPNRAAAGGRRVTATASSRERGRSRGRS
jgi:hypothetical protein